MSTLTRIGTAALAATLAGATVAPGQKPATSQNVWYDPTRELWRDIIDTFTRLYGTEADDAAH